MNVIMQQALFRSTKFGCHIKFDLCGGVFTADPHRIFSAKQLLDASLPFADVRWDGELMLGKADNSGGELSAATCSQQLLYEIGDPAAYITPDVVSLLYNSIYITART